MSNLVSQEAYFVRSDVIFFQKHFQLTDADSEVTIGKLVGNVEAQRPEFPSLDDDCVEQAQRLQQVLELVCLPREKIAGAGTCVPNIQ